MNVGGDVDRQEGGDMPATRLASARDPEETLPSADDAWKAAQEAPRALHVISTPSMTHEESMDALQRRAPPEACLSTLWRHSPLQNCSPADIAAAGTGCELEGDQKCSSDGDGAISQPINLYDSSTHCDALPESVGCVQVEGEVLYDGLKEGNITPVSPSSQCNEGSNLNSALGRDSVSRMDVTSLRTHPDGPKRNATPQEEGVCGKNLENLQIELYLRNCDQPYDSGDEQYQTKTLHYDHQLETSPKPDLLKSCASVIIDCSAHSSGKGLNAESSRKISASSTSHAGELSHYGEEVDNPSGDQHDIVDGGGDFESILVRAKNVGQIDNMRADLNLAVSNEDREVSAVYTENLNEVELNCGANEESIASKSVDLLTYVPVKESKFDPVKQINSVLANISSDESDAGEATAVRGARRPRGRGKQPGPKRRSTRRKQLKK